MRPSLKILLLYYLSMSCTVFAIDKTGTTAAKFLTIGIGSRPAGLGNAFVSIADDPTAMYWNPAGISRLGGHEAIVNHNNWFAGISLDYSGAVIKLSDNAAFGANITMVSMEEIEVTRYGVGNTRPREYSGNPRSYYIAACSSSAGDTVSTSEGQAFDRQRDRITFKRHWYHQIISFGEDKGYSG